MDRTINFGDDAADARYRIQDTSSTGGDFVLAEDLDGGTVLLEYDYSASEWVSRGPVNLNGNDITNAGSITADTLEANDITTDTPSGITDVASFDPDTQFFTSDRFDLSDDSKQILINSHSNNKASIIMAANATDNVSAIFTAANGDITEHNDSSGIWATSDSDTDNCVFRDGSNNLVLKNRTGSTKTYSAFLLNLSV